MAARRPAPPPTTSRTSCEEISSIMADGLNDTLTRRRFQAEFARCRALCEAEGTARRQHACGSGGRRYPDAFSLHRTGLDSDTLFVFRTRGSLKVHSRFSLV